MSTKAKPLCKLRSKGVPGEEEYASQDGRLNYSKHNKKGTMSQANNQALVTLAAITGCLVQMRELKCFSVVTKKDEVTKALDLNLKIGRFWFENFEDNSTDVDKMQSNLRAWGKWLDKVQGSLTCGGLSSAASRLCSDLEEKLKNKTKKRLVGELKAQLLTLEMYATSDGTRFDYLEEGNMIVDKLQEELAWTDTNFVKSPT